jgi:hypothetical protein
MIACQLNPNLLILKQCCNVISNQLENWRINPECEIIKKNEKLGL